MLARVLMIMLITCSSAAADSFCHRHTYNSTSGSSLRFTKDLASIEYSAVGAYKSLPCCVEGFSSISWYRDSVPLNQTNSTFSSIDDGRYIESKYLQAGDVGEFTCVAMNSTHNITHSVNLKVLVNQQYNGPPLAAYRPVDQWAQLGEQAKFRCSAFIGFGLHRLNVGEIYWLRSLEDMDFAQIEGHSEATEFNYSSGGEIRSSYLTIPHVDIADFGPYICVVSNGHVKKLFMPATLHRGVDPSAKIRSSYTAGLVMMGSVLFLALVVTLIYLHWRVEIHLYLKDKFGDLEADNDAKYDVFVCYSGEESGKVVGWLVPHLENTLGYSCFVFERDMYGGEWMPDTFATKLRESRRFLVVLTSGLVHDAMSKFACQLAVDEALSPRSLKLLCLWPGERRAILEEASVNQSLRVILNVAKKITLPRDNATSRERHKFWNNVRLQLPARRAGPSVQTYLPLTTRL